VSLGGIAELVIWGGGDDDDPALLEQLTNLATDLLRGGASWNLETAARLEVLAWIAAGKRLAMERTERLAAATAGDLALALSQFDGGEALDRAAMNHAAEDLASELRGDGS